MHANATALRAVLADIEARGIDRIVCLGDIVGYGPEPLACVDLVRERCAWSLMGNHDFAVLYEPTNFNPMAAASAYWTREQFDAEPDEAKRTERYNYLGRLKVRVVDTDSPLKVPLLAVHGSPRRPINEYIFDKDVRDAPEKLEAIFERFHGACVVGHTHVPGVFTDEPDFYPPVELGPDGFRLREGEKVIINVGSVGQPRDGDPRACYVVLHEDRVEFVRVAYDVADTANKIKAIAELDDYLGDRLFGGA